MSELSSWDVTRVRRFVRTSNQGLDGCASWGGFKVGARGGVKPWSAYPRQVKTVGKGTGKPPNRKKRCHDRAIILFWIKGGGGAGEA